MAAVAVFSAATCSRYAFAELVVASRSALEQPFANEMATNVVMVARIAIDAEPPIRR